MPTFEDFAFLSSLIYSSDDPIPSSDSPWVFVQRSPQNSSGYFGAVYRNRDTNEWVLVNRGTQPIADFVNDVSADVQVLLGQIPTQFADAQSFYEVTRNLASQNEADTLSITGHSLGGSLTQLLVAQNQSDVFNGSEVFGVTFNALGAEALLSKLEPPLSEDQQYNLTNWVVPSDILGNLANHVGIKQELASLPFSYVYPLAVPGVVSFLFDSHSIDEILNNFIADNSHPLLAETREFLLQTYVTDFGFPVTVDGQVIVGGNNRINVGNELNGSAQNDLLFGGLPDDRIHGGGGQDVIYAGNGNDTIWGDAGADIMLGEDGNDTYIVDDVNDRVIEAALGGTDTVTSTVSHTLSRNVEQLILQGADVIDGTGNALDNVLIGNNASNRLDGDFGADTMAGGTGDDTYIVDNVRDRVVEAEGEGIDTVKSSVDIRLAANVERLVFTGGTLARGNDLNGELINQSAGAILVGGQGDDTYILEATGTLIEAADGGTDTVQSVHSVTLGDNIESLVLTGTSGKENGDIHHF